LPSEPAAPRRRRLARLRRVLGRIPHPPLRSRRGMFIVFVLVAGSGAAMAVGSALVIAYTDTPTFCGACHLMSPEIKAYDQSPHRQVACVDCHTEPGLDGWIQSKITGARQLYEVVTGTFPRPIPPPDHSQLPPVADTCLRCHDIAPLVAGGGPIKLILRDQYGLDQASTRQTVALVVRPSGFGGQGTPVGVHWHIASDVEFITSDPHAQTIDYVAVTYNDGTSEQFIASRAITQSDNVDADIARLTAATPEHRMDCIDCHNRVGHETPDVGQAIDQELDSGAISADLPSIKAQALARLSVLYPTQTAADNSIAGLEHFYSVNYPLVAASEAAKIQAAVSSLQTLYRLVATPDLAVSAATYPNNIGHQSSPGCFRCHDGAHYRVIDGKVTNETIPSQCSTCHTFPQIGVNESGVLIGQRPSSHDDRLWVFDHKLSVTSADPSNQSCGVCHTATYCENCHRTTAVQVSHDNMVTNHAEVIRQVGASACAFCHAPAYCAQCHADPVMPVGPAGTGTTSLLPDEDNATAAQP
jgi:nitrate/TMAO reductase-like tetraheme cytochrome c subunit